MNTVAEKIRAEIAEQGAISFARFMELALYCPLCGYYEKKKDTLGRRGDFYTSVSVGSLFGQMLAFQFAEWYREVKTWNTETGNPKTLRIVEAGAHDGRLAADILTSFQRQHPALFDQIDYVLIEPSPTRRNWQSETLRPFAYQVRWFDDLETLHSPVGARDFTIIFSNELLDAFPVHRLGWDTKAKHWFEWGVTVEHKRFAWTRLANQSAICNLQSAIAPPELLEILPNLFTIEISPTADQWWSDAANSVAHGKLVTFDYGLTAEEFFRPQRAQGTLRAYHRHQFANDPLANPGEQDLTAHVNFTSIQQAGERAGLKTESFATQAQFLTRIAENIWRSDRGFGEWTPEHSRQFQTLTHPNHLGRAFRVLVQSRAERSS